MKFQLTTIFVFCSLVAFSQKENLSIRYLSWHGLVILPVTLNDSIQLRLLVDTAAPNIILFSEKSSHLKWVSDHSVKVAGLGKQNIRASLSLGNVIDLGALRIENVPVLGANRSSPPATLGVDGIIGYDLFSKFEVEIDPRRELLTLRDPVTSGSFRDSTSWPIRIVNGQPVLGTTLSESGSKGSDKFFLIDTGSSSGLIFNISDVRFGSSRRPKKDFIGVGINGLVDGYQGVLRHLKLGNDKLQDIPFCIVDVPERKFPSIGMQVLKDFIVTLNYTKEFIDFQPVDPEQKRERKNRMFSTRK
jgi:hypothetical protein